MIGHKIGHSITLPVELSLKPLEYTLIHTIEDVGSPGYFELGTLGVFYSASFLILAKLHPVVFLFRIDIVAVHDFPQYICQFLYIIVL